MYLNTCRKTQAQHRLNNVSKHRQKKDTGRKRTQAEKRHRQKNDNKIEYKPKKNNYLARWLIGKIKFIIERSWVQIQPPVIWLLYLVVSANSMMGWRPAWYRIIWVEATCLRQNNTLRNGPSRPWKNRIKMIQRRPALCSKYTNHLNSKITPINKNH